MCTCVRVLMHVLKGNFPRAWVWVGKWVGSTLVLLQVESGQAFMCLLRYNCAGWPLTSTWTAWKCWLWEWTGAELGSDQGTAERIELNEKLLIERITEM